MSHYAGIVPSQVPGDIGNCELYYVTDALSIRREPLDRR